MAMASSRHGLPLVLSALLLAVLTLSAQADVKRYQFDVSIYTYMLLIIIIALVARGFVVVDTIRRLI